MEFIFWISLAGVVYAYFGYPLVLVMFGLFVRDKAYQAAEDGLPDVTLLIPAHNEAAVIGDKLANALELEYPGCLQVLVVSDGSTDGTAELVREQSHDPRIQLLEINDRKGKANALNRGLEHASGEIIVFTDASIMLDGDALCAIIQPFSDPEIGCVSGEDRIAGGGGEGLYGRYELFLRRQEAHIGSLVGASGSFYAQRRELVRPFPEGLAPDFLSVLNTVRAGKRAIAGDAVGWMAALEDARDEFQRKVRTVVRGMTALFANSDLLSPLRYPVFSLFLWSHKVLRWAVPFFLAGMLLASAWLADNLFFGIMLAGQILFYVIAISTLVFSTLGARIPGATIAQFFCVSNAAILVAWFRYLGGFRQELWNPSDRGAVG